METHEHEDLRKRVEALERDFNFAAGKCAEGLHAVTPVVRERITQSAAPENTGELIVVREFFLSCPHCDKLFGIQTDILGGIHCYEFEVDKEKLIEARSAVMPETAEGQEVIETELLDDDEFDILDGDDNGEDSGGGLHRF